MTRLGTYLHFYDYGDTRAVVTASDGERSRDGARRIFFVNLTNDVGARGPSGGGTPGAGEGLVKKRRATVMTAALYT